jgi:hypothetical protein
VNRIIKKGRILVFISAVIAVILGIYLANVNDTLNAGGECDITRNTCKINVLNSQISVKFEQPPITEEELFLEFEFGKGIMIEQAWIEGVNMYMGKTPVLFEDSSKPQRAVTFLGSCNLSQMQWRLHLNVKTDDSQMPTSVSVPFSTFR